MLALFVLIGALANRRRTNLTLAALLAGYAVVTFATDWRQQMSGVDSAMRFMLAFFIGGSFYLFGHHIRLQLGVAVTLAASAALAPPRLRQVFALAYGVLWFARIPTGVIRSFNGLGDYSYGLYSLSFPIQQTFILMDRIFTPGALLVCSFPALLGLSHAIVASRRAAGVETQSLCACVAAQRLASAPLATIVATASEGLSAAARGPTCAASNRCGSYSRPRSSLRSPAPPDHPATDSLAQPSAQSCRCRPRS